MVDSADRVRMEETGVELRQLLDEVRYLLQLKSRVYYIYTLPHISRYTLSHILHIHTLIHIHTYTYIISHINSHILTGEACQRASSDHGQQAGPHERSLPFRGMYMLILLLLLVYILLVLL